MVKREILNIATAMKKINTIAIGGFDGMHLGHQKLFSHLGEKGAIVIIDSGFANLTPDIERQKYTQHEVVFYKLDDIRHLDAAGFMDKLHSDFPQLAKIVVGYDFHFGKDRCYKHSDIKNYFDGEVVIVDEVKVADISVHSHKIRHFLKEGNIKTANQLLTRNYKINGISVSGQGLGKKELFATINIHQDRFLLPREGVYSTLARINDEEHSNPSVTFFGHRVSTDGQYSIETHIIDKDIGEVSSLEISFLDFIRPNEKFESLELLKNAIQNDIKQAKREHLHLSL